MTDYEKIIALIEYLSALANVASVGKISVFGEIHRTIEKIETEFSK